MEWKRFAIFNVLGVTVWVTTIAFIGYAFARHFQTLLGYMENASRSIAAGLFTAAYMIWRQQRKKYRKAHPHPTPKAT